MRNLTIFIFLFCSFQGVNAQEVHGEVELVNSNNTHVHMPEGGIKKQTGPITVKNIQLLTHESILEKNIEINKLSDFIKQLETAIKSSYQNNEQGELLVKIELKKSERFEIAIQHQGNLSQSFLQKIYDNIANVKSINTQNDSVQFQVHYLVGLTGV